MRILQPVLKLMFVGVIAFLVLSRPHAARAFPVGQYTCTDPWTACYDQTTTEMSQCMGSCYEYGGTGQQQLCYNTVETVTYRDGDQIVDTAQTCNSVPSGTYNCAQACVYNFEFEMDNCFSQFCSQN